MGIVLALLVGTVCSTGHIAEGTAAERRQLQRELALARKAGMPTTANELRAVIPAVALKDNAAPLYSKDAMKGFPFRKLLTPELIKRASWACDTQTQTQIRNVIQQAQEALARYDKAVLLPHCRFDKPWEDGPAVLWPEATQMKQMSKVYLLKGCLAAEAGHPAEAIQCVKAVAAMSHHLSETPDLIVQLVRISIESLAMRQLADWAWNHPEEPAYRHALESTLDQLPHPSLRWCFTDSLQSDLAFMDIVRSPAGRAKLGIKGPASPRLKSLSVTKGKIWIVEGHRQQWAALEPHFDENMAGQGQNRAMQGLFAIPDGAQIYWSLGYAVDSDTSIAGQVREALGRYEPLYRAFLRAQHDLSEPFVRNYPDLLSSKDGKPVTATWDGEHLTIDDRHHALNWPPAAPKENSQKSP